ncbi:hypothetical protein AGABI1DRAFT_89015 [Agaricus bisporus var. burnettii JB137-S8]|uniref:Uncharacterized protein n=1 Tax=Agaricus bisporus var. burnettii (strain JB137-S8 / ATCC MYA-4627 / FGSC 10392) TaxID=597362 RepID=K5XL44_AGABU|nr:uncharacterized protein AGABI1DRAFT_89015 [Agaricus bisporus var. burnettii JB137-S8]EKM84283.1 hypothetical protein AGABI1DRAFT_89015 [Agaricus bisporus var. burnettii JB137-S8]
MPLPRQSSKYSKKTLSSNASSLTQTDSVPEENGKAGVAASPLTPSSKPTFHKADRAYEHERQRLKKAADFVKMRTKKAHHGTTLSSSKGHARNSSSSLTESGTRLGEKEDYEQDDIDGQVLSDSWKENIGFVAVAIEQPSRYEVKLADLLRVGKKPRKSKGANDFEVIPHIRSVIVLDDNTPDELTIDEPWEHVNDPDTEDTGLSYAQVAAIPKQ